MKQNKNTSPSTPENEKIEGYTKGEITWKYLDGNRILIYSEMFGAMALIEAVKAAKEHEANAKRFVGVWNGWDLMVQSRSESMLHISNLNGEITELKEANKELAEAFEKRGTQLREYMSTLKMLTEAATGSSITKWPQLKIAKELLNK